MISLDSFPKGLLGGTHGKKRLKNPKGYDQIKDELTRLRGRIEKLRNRAQHDTQDTLERIRSDISNLNHRTQKSVDEIKANLNQFQKRIENLRAEIGSQSWPDKLRVINSRLTRRIDRFTNEQINAAERWYNQNLSQFFSASPRKKSSKRTGKRFSNKFQFIVDQSEISASRAKKKTKTAIKKSKKAVETVMKSGQAHSTVDVISTNVIDIRDSFSKLKDRVTAKESTKLKGILKVIDSCYSDLEKGLEDGTFQLSSRDRKTFDRLGDDLYTMQNKIASLKGKMPKNMKNDVIPLFKQVESECDKIKKGIKKTGT